MISRLIDSYLETLTGYIFDEDKLVTYKWLSKELDIHVNLAKQILWEFWKQHESHGEITATFTLMGYLVGGGLRVEVVKESDLATAKAKFSKLTTEHLYSLQRALPNLEVLALTDNGSSCHGAIICKEIGPRSGQELNLLRWGSKLVEKLPIASNATKSVPKMVPASTAKVEGNTVRSGFNNLFAKTSNEKAKLKPTTSTESENIQGRSTDDAKSDLGKEKSMVQNDGNANVKIKVANDSASAARGQKRQSSDQTKKTSKRQKRGGPTSKPDEDSSDSDDMECHLPLSPQRPLPSEETRKSVSPPLFKMEQGKRKVRKTVDKMFTDKDGYLVTRKEYVYESCSDKEEEAPKVEPQKPKSAPVAGRKQATLLNFFKKS